MSDNRKYYYLKLKENYFDEDAIVLLESMQDGILYSNILLKLYLKSLKNGGKLQLDENIPYTAQMIATITRQQVGTVERALQIFMKLGLVEPLPSGALYMSNIELLIGQSSTEGERKRRARLALQEQKALPKAGADKCPPYQADICPPEIEIEKEIDHLKTIQQEWKKRGLSFVDDDKIRLVSVVLHDQFSETDNSLMIGHVGVMLPTSDAVYFVEKVAFQEPYRLLKFKNRTELSDYLMLKYDNSWGQDTAHTFIMENSDLMDGWRILDTAD